MSEPVDIVFPAESERRTCDCLMDWQKLHGTNSMMWITGDTADGRKVIIDVPMQAVGWLLYHQIPLETRPRDPRRPLPIFG
jgi:hypothetical protein